MRVIVTGASGFVGRHLVQHLLDSGDEVIGTALSASDPSIPHASYKQIVLDVSDYEDCSVLVSDYKPEVIYHLAGIAFVPEAEDNFDKALLVNVGGTNNLVRSCHLMHLGTTIVYVSSAEVYGRVTGDTLPVDEEVIPNPANNYSLSKLMGELVTKRYEQFGYVRTIVMRPFNHIGPGQDRRFVVPSFASQLAQIARGEVEPVIRVGNLEAKRDFSDVRDIVKAYRLAALKGIGKYNLASGKPVKIKSILDSLIAISGISVDVQPDPARMRPSEVPLLYGDYTKAKAELGWEPQISLESTLEDVYQDCLKD